MNGPSKNNNGTGMKAVIFPVLSNKNGWRLFQLRSGIIVKKPYSAFDYISQIVVFALLTIYLASAFSSVFTFFFVSTWLALTLVTWLFMDRFIVSSSLYLNKKRRVIMSGRTFAKVPFSDEEKALFWVSGQEIYSSFQIDRVDRVNEVMEVIWSGGHFEKVYEIILKEIKTASEQE
jgi:hypothetical protein